MALEPILTSTFTNDIGRQFFILLLSFSLLSRVAEAIVLNYSGKLAQMKIALLYILKRLKVYINTTMKLKRSKEILSFMRKTKVS